jgi:hypothetical protein
MNEANASLLLHRIFSKTTYFIYQDEQYELRFPDNNLKYQADLIYFNTINEEKYNNWIREEDMLNWMISLEIWTHDTNHQIDMINKQIEENKLNLYESFKVSTKKDIDRKKKNLRVSEQQINNIMNKKYEFRTNTLEGYADSIKHEFIITSTLYKNNKPVFNNKDNTNAHSFKKFNDLMIEINKNIMSQNQLRQLAKHDMWRSYWNCSKNSTIFDGAVINWTDEQRNLYNISRMYDSVYEHPNCPDDEVIQDDDLLDGWMVKQHRENKKHKKQKELESKNSKLSKAQEVFLMANTAEDIKEINSMNDVLAKHTLIQNMSTINSQGEVDDSQLPGTKQKLHTQAQQALKIRKNF